MSSLSLSLPPSVPLLRLPSCHQSLPGEGSKERSGKGQEMYVLKVLVCKTWEIWGLQLFLPYARV